MRWITDRRPNYIDSINGGYVWYFAEDLQQAFIVDYDDVAEGKPWQRIQEPDGYVKPKYWEPCINGRHWSIRNKKTGEVFLTISAYDKAVRICNVLNEK